MNEFVSFEYTTSTAKTSQTVFIHFFYSFFSSEFQLHQIVMKVNSLIPRETNEKINFLNPRF